MKSRGGMESVNKGEGGEANHICSQKTGEGASSRFEDGTNCCSR